MKTNIYKKMKYLMLVAIFIASSIKLTGQDVKDLYDLDLTALMNIEIVSASKKAENLFDAPLGASVITGDELKNAGATSIMEGLRLIPGVIVRETTPGNFDIHLRGYDAIDPNGLIQTSANSITLIMVNNRPVYSEFQGQTIWELLTIGIDDVEKIEVVRGPVAAMYGPNAVAGVINILTKKPNLKEGITASSYSQYGMYNNIISSTSIGYAMKNGFAARASCNYDVRDRHNVDYYIYSNKKAKTLLTTPQGEQFATSNTFVDWVETMNDSLLYNNGLLLVKNPSKNGILNPVNINDRYPNPDMALDKLGTNLHLMFKKEMFEINGAGGFSKATAQKIYGMNNFAALSVEESELTYAQIWGRYKNLINLNADYHLGQNVIAGSGSALNFDFNVLNANIEGNYDVTKNFNLKPGFSYRKGVYNSMFLGSTYIPQTSDPDAYLLARNNRSEWEEKELNGDVENTAISGHLRGEFSYKKLRIIAAGRADKFEFPDKIIFSPLIATTYKFTDDFLIRANYGKASRTPFLMDLFTKLDLMALVPSPNPAVIVLNANRYRGIEHSMDNPKMDSKINYDPVTIEQAEIGFRHRISKTFTLDIEAYWSQMTNLNTLTKLDTTINPNLKPLGTTPPYAPYLVVVNNWYSFIPLDAKPNQIGATMSIISMPADNIMFQIYVMAQETYVKKYYDSLDNKGQAVDSKYEGTPTNPNDDNNTSPYREFFHQATPTIVGGVNMNYKPIKPLNFNSNIYFYGRQTLLLSNGYGTQISQSVPANIIINATLTYEIFKKDNLSIKIFASGKNLIFNPRRQYAYADKIYAYALGGFNFNF